MLDCTLINDCLSQLYPAPNGPELDGFTLRRTGDFLKHIKIVIDLKQPAARCSIQQYQMQIVKENS
jgi:hypothetical protein